MLRTFFRPGWIVLGLIVVAFAALCFSILAPWQLGKNSSTEKRNDLIRVAVDTPAAPVDDIAPPGKAFDPNSEWREVSIAGRYLTDQQVIVRLRSAQERPATEILTPFVSSDGRSFLVDRGFVRPEQGRAVAEIPVPPTEVSTIHARIRKSEGTSPGRGAHIADGTKAVYTIDPDVVGSQIGQRFDDFYLQLSANQPGSLGEITLPQLDSGPYLSYGLQWLAFGIMAPLGAGYFIYTEVKHRRALRNSASSTASIATSEATEDSSASPGAADQMRDAGFVASAATQRHQIGSGPDASEASDDVKTKLAKRYGG
ncbi:SURF1 family protein [Gordonia sp. CPCC 205333]|uniref:SURF1 family cytochrome oxidase biogenesis protein n=1 Tax=Gordonia sp. CPCC 205333 TaxID=3140790 RepID=UPI003AF38A4F